MGEYKNDLWFPWACFLLRGGCFQLLIVKVLVHLTLYVLIAFRPTKNGCKMVTYNNISVSIFHISIMVLIQVYGIWFGYINKIHIWTTNPPLMNIACYANISISKNQFSNAVNATIFKIFYIPYTHNGVDSGIW